MALSISLGLGLSNILGVPLTDVLFSLTQNPSNEFELDGATGIVTVTVTSPAVYANYDAGNGAGVFIFNSADLASGPVNLVPPQVIDDGTPAGGETLTLTPGLWAYDPDIGGIGSPTYQWQADTAGNGTFADISGATSNSYTLTAGEAGDDVRVQESLSDNAGSRTANSAAVSVAGGAGAAVSSATVAADTVTRPGYALYVFEQADSGGNIVFSSGGNVEALCVGSGAGGGAGNTRGGGGGGGGEVVQNLALAVSATSYTITVGAGGTGGISFGTAATDGSASSIGALLSAGGGGYGGRGDPADVPEADGSNGSGGGAGAGGGSNSGLGGTSTGTGGAGGNGSTDAANSGAAGGGGGGAGGAGVNAVNSTSGGAGGNGSASSIIGSPVTYGGGGGGGTKNVTAGAAGTGGGGAGGDGAPGTAGTNGLGGGGGAGGGSYDGASGGHGRVIIAVAL